MPTPWKFNFRSWWIHLDVYQRIAYGALAAMLAIGLIAVAWMNYGGKSVDVVNGVPAVSNQFTANAFTALNELRDMPPAQRAGYINAHYPNIGRNILTAMRDAGKIGPNQTINRIEYRYGSMSGVVAETAGGGTAAGHFKDQLLAVVYPSGGGKPVVMLVLCSNGLVDFPAGALNRLQSVGGQTATQMAFTIGRGEGLTTYVDYRTAISLARRFNLPIWKRAMGGRYARITADEALGLEADTDNVLVAPRVYAGDHFDLATMTYTPARSALR